MNVTLIRPETATTPPSPQGQPAAASPPAASPPAEQTPPSEPGRWAPGTTDTLEAAARALQRAGRVPSPYALVPADRSRPWPPSWRAMWDVSAPQGPADFEADAARALAAWRSGQFELPDYYLVLAAEPPPPGAETSPAPDFHLGPLARCGRTGSRWWPRPNLPSRPRASLHELGSLRHGPWWPGLDEVIEVARRFYPDSLAGRPAALASAITHKAGRHLVRPPHWLAAEEVSMPGPQAPALEFAGLYKRFGDNVAVDHIDLSVPPRSFFGLVGPNGAGKTTSLSMATGLLRPDGGTAAIFGHDVWRDPVGAKTLAGVLPDGLALPDRPTGREVLTYLGLLRGLPRDVVTERADELLRVLELDAAGGTVVADYSTGMRKKITLATALIHNPGCWSWTSRSRRSTRCRPPPSARSCSGSWPAAARWCSPAT